MDCEEVKALNFVKRSLLKKNEEIKFLSDRLQTVTDNFNELKWKYSKLKEEIKGRLVDEASTNASSEVEIQEAEIMEESSLREDANDETAHHDFLAVKTESFEPVGGFGGQQAGHELLGVAHGDELIPHSHPSLSTYDSPVGNVITQSFSAPTMQPLASSQALSQVDHLRNQRVLKKRKRRPVKEYAREKGNVVPAACPANEPSTSAFGDVDGGAVVEHDQDGAMISDGQMPRAAESGELASRASLLVRQVRPTETPGRAHYECSVCGYSSALVSNVTRHVKAKHLEYRPYQCPVCPHRAALRCDLRLHVARRHGQVTTGD